jgi:D-sedoheptulose 7-phosphate isomerase
MSVNLSGKLSDYINGLAAYLPHDIEELLESFFDRICEAFVSKKQIVFIGNGGSYCCGVHWSTDLALLGFSTKTITPAIITAFANDFGYEKSYGQNHDFNRNMLVAFSVSGKSKNILHVAKPFYYSVLFTGKDYDKEAPYNLIIPIQSNDYGLVEDMHLIIGHYVKRKIEKWMKTELKENRMEEITPSSQ